MGDVADGATEDTPDGRVDSACPDWLETLAVATFNVVTFDLAFVIAGQASGMLADARPEFGILHGIATFDYLLLPGS